MSRVAPKAIHRVSNEAGLRRQPRETLAKGADPAHQEMAGLQESAGNNAVGALLGEGAPLDPAVRADMEARFGENFADVRIHDDGDAHRSAAELDAKAYTVGNNISFSAERYAPHGAKGKRLLAHELAHVVQQSRGGAAPEGDLRGSLEQSATRAALQATTGNGPVAVDGASGVGVMCDAEERTRIPDAWLHGTSPMRALSAAQQLLQRVTASLGKTSAHLEHMAKAAVDAGARLPDLERTLTSSHFPEPEDESRRIYTRYFLVHHFDRYTGEPIDPDVLLTQLLFYENVVATHHENFEREQAAMIEERAETERLIKMEKAQQLDDAWRSGDYSKVDLVSSEELLEELERIKKSDVYPQRPLGDYAGVRTEAFRKTALENIDRQQQRIRQITAELRRRGREFEQQLQAALPEIAAEVRASLVHAAETDPARFSGYQTTYELLDIEVRQKGDWHYNRENDPLRYYDIWVTLLERREQPESVVMGTFDTKADQAIATVDAFTGESRDYWRYRSGEAESEGLGPIDWVLDILTGVALAKLAGRFVLKQAAKLAERRALLSLERRAVAGLEKDVGAELTETTRSAVKRARTPVKKLGKSAPEFKPKVEPKPEPVAKPKAKAEPKVEPKAKAKPQAEQKTKPGSKVKKAQAPKAATAKAKPAATKKAKPATAKKAKPTTTKKAKPATAKKTKPTTKPAAKTTAPKKKTTSSKTRADDAKRPFEDRFSDARGKLTKSRVKTREYLAKREAEGLSRKGGPKKGIDNAKEEMWLLKRQKAYPNRQILAKAEIQGVRMPDGSIKPTKEISGTSGREPDFIEIDGPKVNAGELKTEWEIDRSLKGGPGTAEGGQTVVDPGSKLGQEFAAEDAVIKHALENNGKIVVRGYDVATGKYVTREVDPANFGRSLHSPDFDWGMSSEYTH